MVARKSTKAAPVAVNALADIMASINAHYPGSMTVASDPELVVTLRKTGVIPIDDALDGGIPRGRFIEVYGGYSTLKSLVAYKALAASQKRGEKVALLDFEHSWDPEWGSNLGVDVPNLLIARPKTAEEGIGIMEALIRDKFDLIVWDSIAAAQPNQYAVVAPGEDNAPAALARVMSRGLARLNAANKHTTAIFINQTRDNIGVTFGAKSTTSGGKAMGYYASMRMSFTRIGKITETIKKWDGEKMMDVRKVIAHKIQMTLEKSKVSAPTAETIFVFDLRTGDVDNLGYLIARGLEEGIIERDRTGRHSIPDIMTGTIHGAAKFREWVETEQDAIDYLEKELLK
jgi:recombination protein RecA